MLRGRPTVHPVRLDGEQKATARKVRSDSPALGRGVEVWVEVEDGRWQHGRIVDVVYSALVIRLTPASRG